MEDFHRAIIQSRWPASYQTSRLSQHPTHASSTHLLAWTNNPDGTYTACLALAICPKKEHRGHPHCKYNNKVSVPETLWIYVSSEFLEVQGMDCKSFCQQKAADRETLSRSDQSRGCPWYLGFSTVCAGACKGVTSCVAILLGPNLHIQ